MPIIITKAAIDGKNKSQTICFSKKKQANNDNAPSKNSISGAGPVISGNYIIDHDYYVYYTVRCLHSHQLKQQQQLQQ